MKNWRSDNLNQSAFEKTGPIPRSITRTFEKFKKALKGEKGLPAGRQGKVKQIIMNPEIIAGIGNIYASEALWVAKIHPEKNIAKLSEKELKSLYEAIKKVLLLRNLKKP